MAFASPHQRGFVKYSVATPKCQPKLPEAKIEKLKHLVQREEHKWRHDRVKEYIGQRLELSNQRHQSHHPQARQLIEETVDRIVEDPSFVFKGKRLISSRSKDILGGLEAKLIKDLSELNLPPRQPTRSNNAAGAGEAGRLLPTLELSASGNNAQHRPTLDSRRSNASTVLEKVGTWQLINAFQNFHAQQEEQQARACKLKRMAEYRAFLDRQKREHEELKVKTHEEQAKAREEQVRSYERFKDEQEALKRRIERCYRSEKEKRLEVIEQNQRVKEHEQSERLRAERAMNAVYQRMQQEDEERKRRRKLEERKRQEAIEEENRQEKERRKLVALASAQEDMRLMAEYAKKLEKEEQERKTAFSKRVIKMKNLGDKWASEGAGKVQEAQRLEQERQILEAAMKKEREDQERERRDREKKLADKKKMAEDNLQMSRRHQEEERAAREAELADISRARKEAADLKAKDLEHAMRQRAKQREYVQYLRKQMAEGARNRARADVSDLEKKLNKQLLEQAETDEEFMEYCERQLLPALEGSAAKRKASTCE